MIKILYYIVFFVLLFIFACEDQITSECDTNDRTETTMPAQFNAIKETIFNARCISCHSGSVTSGNLNLSSGSAYSQLISKNLVLPGDSKSSILYIRLNGKDPNMVMPPSGKLAQVLVDSVAAWIDKGALNN